MSLFSRELRRTARSLLRAGLDWLALRCSFTGYRQKREPTFAFLVHPRTDDFVGSDAYGQNDIFRPFPLFRRLFAMFSEERASAIMYWFASGINPITLSNITVTRPEKTYRGYLLSTVRPPRKLFLGAEATRSHLRDLFDLAARKGVARVGLGALLPSMTGNGKRLITDASVRRPGLSTGHAYTGFVISEYMQFLISRRNPGSPIITAAIVGAAGSTGKSLMRVLKRTWNGPAHLQLVLVDLPAKARVLETLALEARESEQFDSVSVSTELTSLRGCDYVVVVTNASGAIVRPEHVRPGTMIIDDSQPRNTSIELVSHGCYVVDVLASIPGLNCSFDFGFKTADTSVTFTCLAETVISTICGAEGDLAVGEVTDGVVNRMIGIVAEGTRRGLIGPLPFFSFGREMSFEERDLLLQPAYTSAATAAE